MRSTQAAQQLIDFLQSRFRLNECGVGRMPPPNRSRIEKGQQSKVSIPSYLLTSSHPSQCDPIPPSDRSNRTTAIDPHFDTYLTHPRLPNLSPTHHTTQAAPNRLLLDPFPSASLHLPVQPRAAPCCCLCLRASKQHSILHASSSDPCPAAAGVDDHHW